MNSKSRSISIPLLAVLLSFGLMIWGLGSRSLWGDEIFTLTVAGYPPMQTITTVAEDIHPPLYFLVMGLWVRLVGTSEFALRLPSVFAAVIALPLTWQLGRHLMMAKAANIGIIFLLFSPMFIEFSRMARYYSFTVALGVLSTLLLVSTMQRDRWWKWVLYGLACALNLYTFYLTFFLILAHGLVLALSWKSRKRQLGKWVVTMGGVFILLVPFLAVIAEQAQSAGYRGADFSRSLLGAIIAALYSLYGFTVGETLFPWFPIAVPAALIMLGLIAWGAYKLPGRWRILLLTVVLLPLFLTIMTVMYVSTGTPFLNVPVRALFILPYIALLLAWGFVSLPRRTWQIGAACVVGLAWGIGIVNGYMGQQYLNPIYLIPAREVAMDLAMKTEADDVVIGEKDTAFPHYFEPIRGDTAYFDALQTDAVIDYLSGHSVDEIWFVTIGRDGTRGLTPVELSGWLRDNYSLTLERGYVEQDPVYRKVKEFLLRRPAYRYKFLVQKYEPAEP